MRISGHVGAVTLGASPILTAEASDLSLDNSVQTSNFIGQGWASADDGPLSGAFNVNGKVDTTNINTLVQMRLTPGTKPFELQVGDPNQASDGGKFTGSVILANFSVKVAGNGMWEFSCSATTDGAVGYTPASGVPEESESSESDESSSSSSS